MGSHTTSTKWQQATTLTSDQPLKQQHLISVNGDKPPVPPPRKKRVLKKARSYEDVLDIQFNKKAGFKDVFGEPVSLERQTTSTSHNHIYDLDNNHDTSVNSLKIGNKKTDKFFGENLSDSLSNEPYVPEESILSRASGNDKDELDMFVETNVQKVEQRALAADKIRDEERLSDNLDKKAAFLMTMLDSYDEKNKMLNDDDERYRGMVPVEEEIIVPKKRITRCICDETDHLLHHLRHDECKEHGKEDESAKKLEKKDVATETPPVKPKRDLTLYRKSQEISDSMPESLDRTPSPPLRRKKSLNNSKEGLNEKLLSVAASEPITQPERSDSPNSILTKDLMDQIVQHAFPHYLDIEDMQQDSYIDGSTAVSEKISKLKERKTSLNRKVSTDSSHSNHSNLTNQELPSSPGPFSTAEGKVFLGCRDVTISPLSFKEEPVRVDSPTRKSVSPEKDANRKKCVFIEHQPPRFEKASSPLKESVNFETRRPVNLEEEASHHLQDDGVNMLEELIRHQQFNTTEDVINEIYKNQSNIVYEFQRFLEDELSKEENSAKLEALKDTKVKEEAANIKHLPAETIESQTIDLVSNSTGSETSSEASTIKNMSDTETDVLHNISDSTQLRRDSVTDLDNWLSPNHSEFPNISETHLDLISSSSDSDNASTIRALSIGDPEDDDQIPELIHNHHLIKAKNEDNLLEHRRESIEDVDIWFTQHLDLPHTDLSQSMVNEDAKKADFLTYDAAKLYPFGQPRERHMSLTDEFFTKPGDQQKEERTKDEKTVKRSNSESY